MDGDLVGFYVSLYTEMLFQVTCADFFTKPSLSSLQERAAALCASAHRTSLADEVSSAGFRC